MAEGIKIVAENRKARHDYEFIEKLEAGLVLTGAEVKSVRAGNITLKESYVRDSKAELFLVGAHISPYKFSRVDKYDPTRERKLLLHREEIERLLVQMSKKGLTLVATKVYFKGGKAKLEIAVARGKKLYDKRQDIKAKEAERDMRRAFSKRNAS